MNKTSGGRLPQKPPGSFNWLPLYLTKTVKQYGLLDHAMQQ